MTQSRIIHRDLVIAFVVQCLAVLFGAITLDMGQTITAIARISIAFWIGVILIVLRRHQAMTQADHMFIRYGLFPMLFVGVPLAFII